MKTDKYSVVVITVLKELRIMKGISSLKLSEICNKNKQFWSRIERGGLTLSVDHLHAVCNILEVSPVMVMDIVDTYYKPGSDIIVEIDPVVITGLNGSISLEKLTEFYESHGLIVRLKEYPSH